MHESTTRCGSDDAFDKSSTAVVREGGFFPGDIVDFEIIINHIYDDGVGDFGKACIPGDSLVVLVFGERWDIELEPRVAFLVGLVINSDILDSDDIAEEAKYVVYFAKAKTHSDSGIL